MIGNVSRRFFSPGPRTLGLWIAALRITFFCNTAEPAPGVAPAEQELLTIQSKHPGDAGPKTQNVAPTTPDGTGRTAWATGFAGQLLRGLDGELYRPYLPATIKRVQSELKQRGLYEGPLNGILDRPTMQSIYAFQQANPYLQRCGVPTPMTRKLLEQGSHTDPASL